MGYIRSNHNNKPVPTLASIISTKEKIHDYMLRILNHFKPHHFKEVVPECFDITFLELENEIKKRKLRLNKKNMIQVLVSEVERSDWEVNDLLTTTFNLELEYMIKHSNQFEWNTSKFVGNSNQGEITDFGHLIQTEVRRDSKDALVLVKKVDDFFWISVIMKNLKKVGIYEKPRYVVLSSEGRYFFTKDNRSTTIVKYIMSTLGYEKEKSIKLTGRSLKSLIKLLARKEKADMNNRPAYEGGTATEKEQGYDFTQKACYNEYFNKCVGGETDIDLRRYTITAMNCPWVGDDTPVLKDMEFKSAMTLSGDTARIIRQLPIASIVRPPIPNYLRNFSVQGRNVVSIKSSLP